MSDLISNPYQAPEAPAVLIDDNASKVVRRSGRLFFAVWDLVTFWLVVVIWNNAMNRFGKELANDSSSLGVMAGMAIAVVIFIVLPVLPQSYFVGRLLGRKLMVSTRHWLIWLLAVSGIMIALLALLASGLAYIAHLQNSAISYQNYFQGIMKAVYRISIYIVLIHALLGLLQYFLCRKLLVNRDAQPGLPQ